MSNFEHLPHEEQMRRLQRLAAKAVLRYDLPDDIEPHLINLSENATYRVKFMGDTGAEVVPLD